MLVITRKAGESVTIGDDTLVQIISTHKGRVRLGITCPLGTQVRRTAPISAEPAGPTGEHSEEPTTTTPPHPAA